jgi:hypothetical protein
MALQYQRTSTDPFAGFLYVLQMLARVAAVQAQL